MCKLWMVFGRPFFETFWDFFLIKFFPFDMHRGTCALCYGIESWILIYPCEQSCLVSCAVNFYCSFCDLSAWCWPARQLEVWFGSITVFTSYLCLNIFCWSFFFIFHSLLPGALIQQFPCVWIKTQTKDGLPDGGLVWRHLLATKSCDAAAPPGSATSFATLSSNVQLVNPVIKSFLQTVFS